jgi:hypothetical protein
VVHKRILGYELAFVAYLEGIGFPWEGNGNKAAVEIVAVRDQAKHNVRDFCIENAKKLFCSASSSAGCKADPL